MGQTYEDYVKACSDAAKSALEAMHKVEKLALVPGSEILDQFAFGFSLTDKAADLRILPELKPTDPVTVTTVATSGNLTAQTTVRKLAEARLEKDEQGRLPFPLNNPRIMDPALGGMLVELNTKKKSKKVIDFLLSGGDLNAWQVSLDRPLTKTEKDALTNGKLKGLTYNGFLTKKLAKRFGFMGSGLLAVNIWNESYSANKWVLHVHDDGEIFGECLYISNSVKRNHV